MGIDKKILMDLGYKLRAESQEYISFSDSEISSQLEVDESEIGTREKSFFLIGQIKSIASEFENVTDTIFDTDMGFDALGYMQGIEDQMEEAMKDFKESTAVLEEEKETRICRKKRTNESDGLYAVCAGCQKVRVYDDNDHTQRVCCGEIELLIRRSDLDSADLGYGLENKSKETCPSCGIDSLNGAICSACMQGRIIHES
jgi:hypothetical protein